MFGLGGVEIVIILVIALLIFGPNKLPEMGRTIGKMMAEFKKVASQAEEAVQREMNRPEGGDAGNDANAMAREASADAQPLTPAATSPEEAYEDDFAYDDGEEE